MQIQIGPTEQKLVKTTKEEIDSTGQNNRQNERVRMQVHVGYTNSSKLHTVRSFEQTAKVNVNRLLHSTYGVRPIRPSCLSPGRGKTKIQSFEVINLDRSKPDMT